MPSTFTWLDYSESERRKMLDVIELFGERATRDELGLGGIRDAFADLLFPGTSTIQTRAKYFLFVPWIYLILEEKQVAPDRVEHRARKLEVELMNVIASSNDSSGLIGKRARENVRRLASSVYWLGLVISPLIDHFALPDGVAKSTIIMTMASSIHVFCSSLHQKPVNTAGIGSL